MAGEPVSYRADEGRRPGPGFLLEAVRLNLMSGMAYRVSFLFQVALVIVNNTIFLAFWWIFFQRFPTVRGGQMNDLVILFCIGAAWPSRVRGPCALKSKRHGGSCEARVRSSEHLGPGERGGDLT